MSSPHTLSAVENELMALNSGISNMGELVQHQLASLLDALRHLDSDALSAVIAHDAEVDAHQGKIEEQLVGMLARIQPMARDLRVVLAAQRVALELERCGDHIKRIAKQVLKIKGALPAEITSRLLWFGNQALALLERALLAYTNADGEQAEQAWAEDSELDEMYHGLLSELLARMRENAEWVEIGVRLVNVAKSMERIGDHATNIAEEARFVALGEILQSRRSATSTTDQ